MFNLGLPHFGKLHMSFVFEEIVAYHHIGRRDATLTGKSWKTWRLAA